MKKPRPVPVYYSPVIDVQNDLKHEISTSGLIAEGIRSRNII
jgi:hypothetical protein